MSWRIIQADVMDGLACACGCGEPAPTDPHHLKPWAGNPAARFDPDNILTLCRSCHIDAHRKGGGANQ